MSRRFYAPTKARRIGGIILAAVFVTSACSAPSQTPQEPGGSATAAEPPATQPSTSAAGDASDAAPAAEAGESSESPTATPGGIADAGGDPDAGAERVDTVPIPDERPPEDPAEPPVLDDRPDDIDDDYGDEPAALDPGSAVACAALELGRDGALDGDNALGVTFAQQVSENGQTIGDGIIRDALLRVAESVEAELTLLESGVAQCQALGYETAS